ncbi:hypothetical protein TNCV_2142601, partial [Trichonephila clavipes]
MVWGSMDSHGVGRLHIVSGTVKAMDYIEILQNKLLPTARDLLGNQSLIFQDDNAPLPSCKVITVQVSQSVHLIQSIIAATGQIPAGFNILEQPSKQSFLPSGHVYKSHRYFFRAATR